MNVGIQDAANLGWKLAAALNGWALEAILDMDTCHAERHPVGADLTATSRAQVALVTASTAEGLTLRDLFADLISALLALHDRLVAQVSSMAVAYPAAAVDSHPVVGIGAPDLRVGHAGLFALLRVDRYLLLDLTGGALRGFDRRGVHTHAGRLEQPPTPLARIRALLVRPDGHIAWASSTTDDTALALDLDVALGTWTGTFGSGPRRPAQERLRESAS